MYREGSDLVVRKSERPTRFSLLKLNLSWLAGRIRWTFSCLKAFQILLVTFVVIFTAAGVVLLVYAVTPVLFPRLAVRNELHLLSQARAFKLALLLFYFCCWWVRDWQEKEVPLSLNAAQRCRRRCRAASNKHPCRH